MSRWIAVTTVVLVPSQLLGAAPQAPHEQAPRHPWVRPPPQAAVSSTQCGPVLRNGYSSIQVNTDARGCNIVGDAANEPSIAIDVTNSKRMAIGWRQFDSVASDFRQAGWGYSHDGGHTWVAPGSIDRGVFGSDPVLTVDTDGVLYFLSINFEETRLFKSFDGGVSWTQPLQVLNYLYDKPWMTVDHSETVGRDNLYINSPQGPLFRSIDRGQTFQEVPSSGVVGTTLATDIDGALLLVEGESLLAFYKSSDVRDPEVLSPSFVESRLRITCFREIFGSPNGFGRIGQAWVATDHSTQVSRGNIYLLVVANLDPTEGIGDPGDIAFLRSTDAGSSWSRPVAINDDPLRPNSWQWFNTMSVAPNGRIDVVWNDTRNSQQPNISELFYSNSNDGGKTWSANIPVSPPFDSWIGWPGGNAKLGDYYDMVSDNLGANVAYAATFNGEQDVYFLRIGPWDCNGNEVDDAKDIASAASKDCNGNDVPDECEYRVDVDGDGLTTVSDWAAAFSMLDGPSVPYAGNCHGLRDADHDGDVDLADFAFFQRVFVSP
jgi:hypothetical protein